MTKVVHPACVGGGEHEQIRRDTGRAFMKLMQMRCRTIKAFARDYDGAVVKTTRCYFYVFAHELLFLIK